MRSFAPLVACLAIAGCANLYKAPDSGGKAQLRIEGEQFSGVYGMRAVYYQGGRCEDPRVLAVISGMFTTKSDAGAQTPGKADLKLGTFVERLIGADEEVNITIIANQINYGCTLPMTFSVEPNKSYRLRYFWSDGKCHAQVDELAATAGVLKTQRVSVKPQQNQCKTGFSGPAI